MWGEERGCVTTAEDDVTKMKTRSLCPSVIARMNIETTCPPTTATTRRAQGGASEQSVVGQQPWSVSGIHTVVDSRTAGWSVGRSVS